MIAGADPLAEREDSNPIGDSQQIRGLADDPVSMPGDNEAATTVATSSPPRPAAPGLDSIDDALVRQRIHATLFASEREGSGSTASSYSTSFF